MGFFGLYGSTAALATTLTLATVLNCIGIGFQRGTHANWQMATNDGTGAPTLTDMGATFAIATGGVLTLYVAAAPNASSVWEGEPRYEIVVERFDAAPERVLRSSVRCLVLAEVVRLWPGATDAPKPCQSGSLPITLGDAGEVERFGLRKTIGHCRHGVRIARQRYAILERRR